MIDKAEIDNIKIELSEARKRKAELENAFKMVESSRSLPANKLLTKGPKKTVDNGLKEAAETVLLESYRVDCLSRKVKQMERQNEVETAKRNRK
jgi:hypothetical protein